MTGVVGMIAANEAAPSKAKYFRIVLAPRLEVAAGRARSSAPESADVVN
jgi:hypothetical protein